MLFRQLFDRTSCTYTYLLADDVTKEAVLIDPVFELHHRDLALLRELGLKLVYTLDSHVHADHVTGAWLMKQALGSSIVLSGRYQAEYVDRSVDHGDAVRFGDHALEVRATPGHTAGCLTFVLADHRAAFTGDCLLIRGAGRTDFQQGDAHQSYRSITEQILSLPEACLIYPAHDYQGRTVSSVSEELRFNARIGGRANEEDFVGFMDNLNLPHPNKMDIAVPANLRCGRPERPHEEVAWAPLIVSYAGIPQVEPDWVFAHQDALTILDVRSPEELDGELGHIEESLCIALDHLRARIDDVPEGRPIIAVCRSGKRSAQATLILQAANRAQVANMAGGLLAWRDLGFPTEAR